MTKKIFSRGLLRKIETIVFVFLIFTNSSNAQVIIKNLKCEMRQNPVGIDVAQPRFSWQLESAVNNVQQISCQIFVASSNENLTKNIGDIWNSGTINQSGSIHIPFKGKALISATKYFWKVNVITNKGVAQLNEPAFFTTGLLHENDWKGKWIGYDKASRWDSIITHSRLSARYFRKEIVCDNDIQSAHVFICGLGLYELFINGNKIGNQVLAPNPTDYRKTVLYNSFDVTQNLKKGKNAIGTILGNGRFFTMRQNYKPYKINNFGFPKMLLQLEIIYKNGTKKIITSDDSWKLNPDGPIRTNNEYDGEEYDATKEFGNWTSTNFDDKNWLKPQLVKAPEGKLVAQPNASMQIMKTINPVSIKQIEEQMYILDMGQNFAGWLQMKNINGAKDQQIKLRFAESLLPNGELYVANLRDAKATDIYTCKGNGKESWEPHFVFHGFRFVEITTPVKNITIDNFEGKLVYDDMATTGTFESSNPTLNTIFKNSWWGIASNYKGMPIDCPQRNERQPWLGDRAVGAQGESFLFDNEKLYTKWMDDIEQSQTTEGSIPDVAPAFWNYYSDDITWPATYIFICNHLYNQYGDIAPIQKHYVSIQKWMRYIRQKLMVNYIITKDKYGDWCVPPESLKLIHSKDSTRNTNGQLIATAYYFKLLSYTKRFAELLHQSKDIEEINDLSAKIKVAFQQKFYNAKLQQYDNNTVTANILPIYFGIAPDSIKPIIVQKIYKKIVDENNSHISTGLIGSQWLMRCLSDIGFKDVAYTIATNATYPSWGYMAANGATTIWELWNGNTADPSMNSQNHVMLLGDLLIWYYENLGGIRTDKTDVGFKKIILKPTIPKDLQFVNASYNSIYGTIKSHWKNNEKQFEWSVTIPANTSAKVYIPVNSSQEIARNLEAIKSINNVKFIKTDAQFIEVEISSGSYKFLINK